MALTKKQLLDTILSSLGYTMIFLGMVEKAGDMASKLPWLFIILGAGVIYAKKWITNAIDFSIVSNIVIQTTGYILLFLGLRHYVKVYLEDAWLIVFVTGLVLFNYHREISDKLWKEFK